MGKSALLIASLLIFLRLEAQRTQSPVNDVYTRLGAYSRLHTDVFSFRANQAALAPIRSFAAGVYSERRFLLQELAFYSAVMALPTATGTFGASGTYYGNAAYNKAHAGIAYGRKLGNKVAIGGQFNYYSFRVAGYGHATAVNAEAGFLIHITDQLHAGVHVYNPTNSKWNKAENEKIPAIYSVGFGFDASDKFTLYTEAQKITGENLGINAGLQYQFTDQLLA
ncbi:MAG: hypothetical protein M3342_23590, partial [Bacteroidota bacterium]|nr:hypothetical protein [Bacteroidota bacterium]